MLALAHELMRSRQVDVDFLIRYTNAPWLVICDEGTAGQGCSRAMRTARRWSATASRARLRAVRCGGRQARAEGRGHACPTDAWRGRFSNCWPSISRRTSTAPTRSPSAAACPPPPSARIAAELAHTAFQEEITVEQPWTDMRGVRHERFIGRPVSFHAMRGISAHSNGFQTCRALHVLQLLLGSVDCPGGFRFKPPYPKGIEAHAAPASRLVAERAAAGPHLGFPRGPEDLCHRRADGQPTRIDKAFTWDAPLVGARADAHGDLQRPCARSLRHRRAVPLHGQHGLELVDEHAPARWRCWPTRTRTASTSSRRSSIPTPIPRRWSPMPTWCCRTPPIWSGTTASRCSTGRSPSRTPRPTRSAGRWSSRTATCAASSRC